MLLFILEISMVTVHTFNVILELLTRTVVAIISRSIISTPLLPLTLRPIQILKIRMVWANVTCQFRFSTPFCLLSAENIASEY
jgi:hypothetical protein